MLKTKKSILCTTFSGIINLVPRAFSLAWGQNKVAALYEKQDNTKSCPSTGHMTYTQAPAVCEKNRDFSLISFHSDIRITQTSELLFLLECKITLLSRIRVLISLWQCMTVSVDAL